MYYTTIIALGLFCISPLLSLPFILWDIYKQHRSGLVLFVLFLSIMAFLTPPVGDLYRHTRDYFSMANYSFEAFRQTLKDDFVTQCFSYFLQACHIKYPVARLVYAFIGFSIKFWIFDDIARGKYSNKDYFLLFLLVFCSLDFFTFVLGVRFCFAQSLFFLGFYLLYNKYRPICGIGLLALASCIHFTFASLSLCAVALYFMKFKMNNKLFLVVGVVSVVFGLIISSYLVNRFFESHNGYLEGQWGTDYQASFKGMVLYYLKRLTIIPLFCFFLMNNKKEDSWNSVIYVLALIVLLTLSLATISERMVSTLSVLLTYYYLRYNECCGRKHERLIIGTAVFMFFCYIYTSRELFTYKTSAYTESLKPLPMVLHHDFDKEWIYGHIERSGEVKEKYK